MTIRVLVVDDQSIVRSAFASIIDAEPGLEVAAQAAEGTEALELARRHTPDLALMDIRMPGMDGLTATRELAALDPPVRVLILTTFEQDEYVFAALRDGASGFLLKDCEPQALVDAIRTVAQGEALLSPAITARLITAFATGKLTPRPATPDPRLHHLTDRETEVLRHVSRGLSNPEIAAALSIGAATVKTHMNAILTKLSLRDRVQATIFAYETGLTTPGTPDS